MKRYRRASADSLRMGDQRLELPGGPPPHAAEPAVIRRKAGIAVARRLPLARGGPAGVRRGMPASTPDHPLHVLAGIGRTPWIKRGRLLVAGRTVNVLAPFRDISKHVME